MLTEFLKRLLCESLIRKEIEPKYYIEQCHKMKSSASSASTVGSEVKIIVLTRQLSAAFMKINNHFSF